MEWIEFRDTDNQVRSGVQSRPRIHLQTVTIWFRNRINNLIKRPPQYQLNTKQHPQVLKIVLFSVPRLKKVTHHKSNRNASHSHRLHRGQRLHIHRLIAQLLVCWFLLFLSNILNTLYIVDQNCELCYYLHETESIDKKRIKSTGLLHDFVLLKCHIFVSSSTICNNCKYNHYNVNSDTF